MNSAESGYSQSGEDAESQAEKILNQAFERHYHDEWREVIKLIDQAITIVLDTDDRFSKEQEDQAMAMLVDLQAQGTIGPEHLPHPGFIDDLQIIYHRFRLTHNQNRYTREEKKLSLAFLQTQLNAGRISEKEKPQTVRAIAFFTNYGYGTNLE